MMVVCIGIFILNFDKSMNIPNNRLSNGLLMRFVTFGKNLFYRDFEKSRGKSEECFVAFLMRFMECCPNAGKGWIKHGDL